jgi:hypothetical protein
VKPASAPRGGWQEAGAHAVLATRGHHAVAVLGDDGAAAAAVAKGLAGAVAPERRVILADLVGDVPVLRDLSTEPDPEGVEDSFDFGISLARIARRTPVENFLLIPSAGSAVEREEIFRSGRWTRLARQCRASGWLLLVAARNSAPGVDALVEQLDGAVLLGSAQPPLGVRVLHRVELPTPERVAPGRAPLIAGAAAAILVAIAAVVLWRAYADMPAEDRSPTLPAVVVHGPDTASLAFGLEPINPGDSGSAAGYAIEIMSANTRAGANLELQRSRVLYPAATMTAVPVGEARATWYRIIAGAYTEPRQADSLLRSAREAGAVGETGGAVVNTPYALLVDSAASLADAPSVVARYVERGAPAYALIQPGGVVLVYVGAFMRPEESLIFAEELGDSETTPRLVYRTGRPF